MVKDWTGGNSCIFSHEEMIDEILKYDPEEIFIGCDSQPVKDNVIFVEAVCVRKESKGGRFWTRKHKVSKSKIPALNLRLIHEVNMACMTAIEIRDRTGCSITVHADVSPHKKNKSNKVAEQVISYIKGLQFKYAIKPDSWASCSVADRRTK